MSDEEVLKKYSIPLDTSGDADTPSYEATHEGEVYQNRYTANMQMVVQEEPIPHFHKDSVAVKVEEVDKEKYE